MAHFALFEDRQSNREITERVVEAFGHTIVEQESPANNLAVSLHLLERIANGEVSPQPDAYLVDADLGNGPEDGAKIVSRIRELGLPGLIIGNSATPWDQNRARVDVDARKDPFIAMRLLEEHLESA